METFPITINFSENAEEEARRLQAEIKLSKLLRELHKGREMSPETLEDIRSVLMYIMDIFDWNLPEIDGDPQVTLLLCSRDLKLSLLLRERGLFRFYRLLMEKNDRGIPLFMTFRPPDGEEPFKNQSDFVRWFSIEAHVPYSLIFFRKKTIQRLLGLGLSLEDAFKICVSKPHTIYDVLEMVGEWDDQHQLVGVSPDIATRVAERIAPSQAEEIESLANEVRIDPTNMDAGAALCEAYKPLVVSLLKEVAQHPSATAAKNLVRHDILAKPEISYRIDPMTYALLVDYIQKEIGPDGTSYISNVTTYVFEPKTCLEIPQQIISDLATRLPVRNRMSLDNL